MAAMVQMNSNEANTSRTRVNLVRVGNPINNTPKNTKTAASMCSLCSEFFFSCFLLNVAADQVNPQERSVELVLRRFSEMWGCLKKSQVR